MAVKAKFKGDGSGYLNGVPARDLDEDEYAALSTEQKHSVRTCGLYDVKPDAGTPAAKQKEGDS